MAENSGAKTAGEGHLVLISVDTSPQSEAAIKYYVDHIHRPGNKVILSHVIELPDMAHARQASISPTQLAEMWEAEIKKSKATEEKYKKIMVEHGVGGVKVRLEGGTKPGQIICKVAEEEKADMIVIGTRGLGSIRRTILGSVSDYVVHHAHCPVVICRHATDMK